MTDIIERVTAALEAVVAERGPDYVYPDKPEYWVHGVCRYQLEDGAPACIIGAAARKINPNIDMPDYDARTSSIIGQALGMEFDELHDSIVSYSDPIDFPHPLLDALNAAQGTQDNGLTWGQALYEYHRTLEES